MAIKIDISAFIKDYCKGIKDKELIVRHNITARELTKVVKKLLSNGSISREQYLERNRKIQQADVKAETDFLKSLHHCPTCSHAQPFAFTICPACGSTVDATPESSSPDSSDLRIQESAPAVTGSPDPLERMLGAHLADLSPVPGSNYNFDGANYVVTSIIGHDENVSALKAAESSGEGPLLSVRIYNLDPSIQEHGPSFLEKIVDYQSGMNDSNIVRIVGTATLEGKPVVVHEFMPTDLAALILGVPDGLPLDLIDKLVPQVLNAVAYTHLHRTKDGIVRKVPHMSLSPSSFLFDNDKCLVKLADCGVWRSKVDIRGHKQHLWEEPTVDPAALAPEAFVLNSKMVKKIAVDIYALGIVLYRLVTGREPFSGKNVEDYSFLHLKTFAVPPRVHRYTIPAWLDGMILKCLEKDPTRRWRSATQMELAIGKETIYYTGA
jgi:serine/threonine protein kinase